MIKGCKDFFSLPFFLESDPDQKRDIDRFAVKKLILLGFFALSIIVALGALFVSITGGIGLKIGLAHILELVGLKLSMNSFLTMGLLGGGWIICSLIIFALSTTKLASVFSKKDPAIEDEVVRKVTEETYIEETFENGYKVFELYDQEAVSEFRAILKKSPKPKNNRSEIYTIIKNVADETLVFTDAWKSYKVAVGEYGIAILSPLPTKQLSDTLYHYSFEGPFKTIDTVSKHLSPPTN